MSSVAIAGRPIVDNRKVRNENPIRVFVIVIAILLLVLAAELIFHLLISPRMLIKRIDVSIDGSLLLDEQSLLAIAEVGNSPYYFEIDTESIVARLESYPPIRVAQVSKSFPDKLKISVWGRTPLVLALVEGESGTIPVTFDSEGVIFQIGESVANFDLPAVSGLTFASVRLGQRIARPLATFLDDLQRIRLVEPALFNLISEIKFVTKNHSGYEVILFAKSYPARVLVGSSIDAELMKRIVLVLDVLSQQEEQFTGEIDFRTNDIVMRERE